MRLKKTVILMSGRRSSQEGSYAPCLLEINEPAKSWQMLARLLSKACDDPIDGSYCREKQQVHRNYWQENYRNNLKRR